MRPVLLATVACAALALAACSGSYQMPRGNFFGRAEAVAPDGTKCSLDLRDGREYAEIEADGTFCGQPLKLSVKDARGFPAQASADQANSTQYLGTLCAGLAAGGVAAKTPIPLPSFCSQLLQGGASAALPAALVSKP